MLGQGGFADVYLGEHIYLKTQAAIKVMQMRLANDDMESFINEARTIAGLKHPHIVRVLDFGIDNGTPFLVMDYAPMGTLRQRYPSGTRLPPAIISSYVKQVAAALQYAHDKKLIHRDIKPENMLLESDNEILLSDFGIALVAQSSRYQNTQDSVGTLAYMAPEQLQGHPRIASDQYALGIVVYEWLTGDRPFHGSFIEMASQHMLVPPPPLREKVPDILSPIEEVVMVALTKDPQRRFANVQAFANAFEQACQSASAQSSTRSNRQLDPTILVNPPGQPLPPTVAINSQGQPLPPTVAIPPRSQLPPDVKVSTSANISRSPGTTLYTYRGHSDWVYGVAWSPDGKYIASASDKVHIWDASAGSRALRYSNHTDWVSAVAWSPDGKRIASASDDGTIHVWDVITGRDLVIYSNHSGPVNAIAWSPDGTRIASGSDDGTVQIWSGFKGNKFSTYNDHFDAVFTVAWAPDGKYIASGGADKTVQVWNPIDRRNILTYRGHSATICSVAWSPDGTCIASASDDETVRLWSTASSRTLLTYHAHSAGVNVATWSPDGSRIASASADQTVRIWDAFNGRTIYTYHSHSNEVNYVAWSSDGKRIASASLAEVQVWQAGQ